MSDWWKAFFDADYIRLWGEMFTPEQDAQQADAIWQLLRLENGSRLLDAPCGYGRLSACFARRGASVLGVDQSEELLAHARLNNAYGDRLRYLRHDLREPLQESGFDAACNVFSSIGYGSEKDDLAIFTTLRRAVRDGGFIFVETNHRDATVAFLSRAGKPASRLKDGTLVVEEPVFDPVAGRIHTCWYWSGPGGSGSKAASLRIYSITELVRLLERTGLSLVSVHKGCSPDLFQAAGADMGGRVGILVRVVA
jgi:SAM-dependent methyltransferase